MSGTSFRLYFPSVLSEISTTEAVTTRDTDMTTTSNGEATVLLVEDEEHMLYLLERIFSKHGYKVLKASDGKTAIKTYQRHKETIDAVLLDIGLPKVAGQDVLRKMKQEKPDVKIVVASGYLEPELKSEINRAGVKYWLQKPYLPNEVIKIFQSVIERESIAREADLSLGSVSFPNDLVKD
jgi:two-component system cell cycle sensor histidine kinase/response regulator CckA